MKSFKEVFGQYTDENKIPSTFANAEVALLSVNKKSRELRVDLKISSEEKLKIDPQEVKNCEKLLIDSKLGIKNATIQISDYENKRSDTKITENFIKDLIYFNLAGDFSNCTTS